MLACLIQPERYPNGLLSLQPEFGHDPVAASRIKSRSVRAVIQVSKLRAAHACLRQRDDCIVFGLGFLACWFRHVACQKKLRELRRACVPCAAVGLNFFSRPRTGHRGGAWRSRHGSSIVIGFFNARITQYLPCMLTPAPRAVSTTFP